LFSGSLYETNTIISSDYGVLFVPEEEVKGTPDGEERNTNYDEEACGPKFGSGRFIIIGEEYYSEG